MFEDTSHKVELVMLFITTFFAFCTDTYWIHWCVASILILTTFIIDVLFYREGDFIYDPDYNHWKDLNEQKEFQFKTD